MIATVGSGGDSITHRTRRWPGPYFQTYMGSNNNATYGFLKVTVSDTQMSAHSSVARGAVHGLVLDDQARIESSPPPAPLHSHFHPDPGPKFLAKPSLARRRVPIDFRAQASVRSSATYASTASESSSTVPMPAGWQPGDVVYVGYQLTSSPARLPSSGWVQAVPQFRSASSTSSLSGVLRRVMQPGDPNSLTISHSSGRFAAIYAAIQAAITPRRKT